MSNVLLKTLSIFVIMSFGYLLRKRGAIDAPFNRMLSVVLINVMYPALIFSSLTRRFTLNAIFANGILPAGSFLIMLTGWLTGLVLCRFCRRMPVKRSRTFLFQSSLNNYSFLPLMLIAVLWGETEIDRLIYSTLGAEIFIWTFGIQAITGQPFRPRSLRHLLSMPMAAMLASFVVIVLRHLGATAGISPSDLPVVAPLSGMLHDTLRITGQATIPTTAIIAGSRMAGLRPGQAFSPSILMITIVRLALVPLLAASLLWLLPVSAENYRILAIVAVMPCALNSVTLAEVYHADADFAAATVQATHLACIITIPLWLRLLGVA